MGKVPSADPVLGKEDVDEVKEDQASVASRGAGANDKHKVFTTNVSLKISNSPSG